MYAWIWRKLPGNLYAKLTQAIVLAVAVGALLWYVIFPWATELGWHATCDAHKTNTDDIATRNVPPHLRDYSLARPSPYSTASDWR